MKFFKIAARIITFALSLLVTIPISIIITAMLIALITVISPILIIGLSVLTAKKFSDTLAQWFMTMHEKKGKHNQNEQSEEDKLEMSKVKYYQKKEDERDNVKKDTPLDIKQILVKMPFVTLLTILNLPLITIAGAVSLIVIGAALPVVASFILSRDAANKVTNLIESNKMPTPVKTSIQPPNILNTEIICNEDEDEEEDELIVDNGNTSNYLNINPHHYSGLNILNNSNNPDLTIELDKTSSSKTPISFGSQ